MRSILLWLIGIPIPIILLLAVCTHHFWALWRSEPNPPSAPCRCLKRSLSGPPIAPAASRSGSAKVPSRHLKQASVT